MAEHPSHKRKELKFSCFVIVRGIFADTSYAGSQPLLNYARILAKGLKKRGRSSVGKSIGLSRQRSRVQSPSFSKEGLLCYPGVILNFWL